MIGVDVSFEELELQSTHFVESVDRGGGNQAQVLWIDVGVEPTLGECNTAKILIVHSSLIF